jgi:hypothetical protein
MDQPHIKTERRKATINELLDAHVAYMRRKNRASVQTVEQVLDDAKIRLAPSKLFRLIREPAECDEQTELFRVHIPVKGFHCRVTDGRVFATFNLNFDDWRLEPNSSLWAMIECTL